MKADECYKYENTYFWKRCECFRMEWNVEVKYMHYILSGEPNSFKHM